MKSGTPPKINVNLSTGANNKANGVSRAREKRNRVPHPIVQYKQNTEITNPNKCGRKTVGPQQDAVALNDKQANMDHQPATTSALRPYLIVPKTMTETTLQPQFEQYGPIKSVLG